MRIVSVTKKAILSIAFIAVLVFTAIMCGCAPQEQETQGILEVHFIDVGQADSALILCDGKSMLIDGGNKNDSSLIYTYLKKHNIKTIDYMVVSHVHEDHIGGINGAFAFAEVKNVLCPVERSDNEFFEKFSEKLSENNLPIIVPKEGDSFAFGSARVDILLCDTNAQEVNNTSIVLKITHGRNSILFTGDAERECEEQLTESLRDLSCDILKVGHHGSSSSTGYRFLRETNPDYAVISCGKDNEYGHPHDEVISRLSDADIEILRTDLLGDIIFYSDGSTLSFSNIKEKEHPSDQDRFVLNHNSMKYHLPTCSSVSQIRPSDASDFYGTEQELSKLGYIPCKGCH